MIQATRFIGQTVEVKVDRPLGSNHPSHGFYYPVNYGYLPGVPAPDGEDLDAYILGIHHALDHFQGECIAVIQRMNDDDEKLIVVPPGIILTDDEIRAQTNFQEQFFSSTILRTHTTDPHG